MTVRHLELSDIPILRAHAEASGFPYPDIEGDDLLIEAVHVVVDSYGNPIMAVAAKRLVEVYMYVDPTRSPLVKMDAMKLAHQSMSETLRAKGYHSCEIFLPPQIAGKFGRRLERTFGWCKNRWENWMLQF